MNQYISYSDAIMRITPIENAMTEDGQVFRWAEIVLEREPITDEADVVEFNETLQCYQFRIEGTEVWINSVIIPLDKVMEFPDNDSAILYFELADTKK